LTQTVINNSSATLGLRPSADVLRIWRTVLRWAHRPTSEVGAAQRGSSPRSPSHFFSCVRRTSSRSRLREAFSELSRHHHNRFPLLVPSEIGGGLPLFIG
jgi:hypothetical protein